MNTEPRTRNTAENTPLAHYSFVEISKIREIEEVGAAIEKMEHDTQNYIQNLTKVTAEKERIGTELALAAQIQAEILPNTFPPFPERHDFDLYANMTTAKEVGGDFYDFFFLDDDHLGLVMADVSGKGVPAALFMMMARLLLNTPAMSGGTPASALCRGCGILTTRSRWTKAMCFSCIPTVCPRRQTAPRKCWAYRACWTF